MSKKKIFAIVVFIVLGLFMYTFANPLNNNSDDNGANNGNGNNNGNGAPTANNNDNTQGNTARNTRRAVNATPVAQTAATTANQDAVIVVNPVEDNKPSIEPVVIDLTIDKLNAVDELTKYKSGYEFTDDTEYKKVIEDYTKKINDSESVKEINDNLQDGKDAIDKLIEDDLSAYKEAAKKEIADYATSLELTTDVTELLKGFYDEIDEATTKSAIDKIVEKAKKALDEVKAAEILAAYKDAAKEEIATYAKELELTTDVTEILDGFNKEIDEAKNQDAVDEVVEAAKKKLDEIKAAEIAKAKEDANKEIDEYKKEDETNLPKIVDVKDEAKEEIKKTDDIEKINEIVENAKDKIDEIINNTEYTVVFYGLMNKKVSTQTVGYKKAATKPKMKATQKGWKDSIEVEFLNWDTEDDTLNSVTSNLEVRAQFKVLKATTKISILKENLKNKDGSEKNYSTDIKDFNHPFNTDEGDTYFNLKITDEITKAVNGYRGSHIFVYTDDNDTIRDVVQGEPDVYDNNKYKELQYYVLKLQGDRFHCDARVIYNHAAELADAKEAAIKAINEYKTVETEDISEIKEVKTAAINAIKDMTSVEDVKGKVQPTKDAIDEIIANKTYDVTFVGKKSSKTVKVGYNKDAVAPTEKDYTNPVYRNVTYKLTGWDKSLKNIKANTTITASYDIEKVVATVFLIGEEYDIPANRSANLTWKAYSKYKEVELKLTDTIKEAIKNDNKATIYTTDREIRATLKDANSLPTKDGKYKTYEFYSMKFVEDSYAGFHIDGKMFYDRDAEALDNAKDELNELIKKAEAKSTEGKTDASVKELKDDIKTAKEVVKGNDIDAIKDSIKELKKDKLVDIKVLDVKVKDNKNGYYVQGQDLDLTVTYKDNNSNEYHKTTKYTITKVTPHRAYVTVGGVDSDVFEFTVVAKVVEKITKVENHQDLYYKNDKLNITVTAKFNDGEVRTLTKDEYTTDFTTKTAGKDIKGTVVATSNENATKDFKYNVSKYNSKAEEDAAKEAEALETAKKAVKDVKVKIKKGNKNKLATIEFSGLDKITVDKVYKSNNKVIKLGGSAPTYTLDSNEYDELGKTSNCDGFVYITYTYNNSITLTVKYDLKQFPGTLPHVSFV